MGLAHLVENIHFGKNLPNHNLRGNADHDDRIEYYDGEDWKYAPRKRIVQQVVDKSQRIMSDHFDDNEHDLRTSMSNAMYTFVDEWMRKMDRSNAHLYLDVMDEVYFTILNRSKAMRTQHRVMK